MPARLPKVHADLEATKSAHLIRKRNNSSEVAHEEFRGLTANLSCLLPREKHDDLNKALCRCHWGISLTLPEKRKFTPIEWTSGCRATRSRYALAAGLPFIPVTAPMTSYTAARGDASLVFRMRATHVPSKAASCAGISSPEEADVELS